MNINSHLNISFSLDTINQSDAILRHVTHTCDTNHKTSLWNERRDRQLISFFAVELVGKKEDFDILPFFRMFHNRNSPFKTIQGQNLIVLPTNNRFRRSTRKKFRALKSFRFDKKSCEQTWRFLHPTWWQDLVKSGSKLVYNYVVTEGWNSTSVTNYQSMKN